MASGREYSVVCVVACLLAEGFALMFPLLSAALALGSQSLTEDFAADCQGRVAGAPVEVNEIKAAWPQFLQTKPSAIGHNVTVLTHSEDGPEPFRASVAIKMKSRAGLGLGPDNVTCRALHAASLAAAVATLTPAERAAYAAGRPVLFADDEEWHTGLWVPFAKLHVEVGVHAVTVRAPAFLTAPTLPFAAGMFYCRLLPPAVLRDWILAPGFVVV